MEPETAVTLCCLLCAREGAYRFPSAASLDKYLNDPRRADQPDHLYTLSPMAALDDYLRHPKHGPLPALLLILTVTTGVVDATSILGLGRVFVANMTGNIVFIGFALAGARGYSVWGSLVALAAFLVGASGGGALIHRTSARRGVAVVAMLVGASVGALLVLALGSVAGLSLALALMLVTVGGAAVASRSTASWQDA